MTPSENIHGRPHVEGVSDHPIFSNDSIVAEEELELFADDENTN